MNHTPDFFWEYIARLTAIQNSTGAIFEKLVVKKVNGEFDKLDDMERNLLIDHFVCLEKFSNLMVKLLNEPLKEKHEEKQAS